MGSLLDSDIPLAPDWDGSPLSTVPLSTQKQAMASSLYALADPFSTGNEMLKHSSGQMQQRMELTNLDMRPTSANFEPLTDRLSGGRMNQQDHDNCGREEGDPVTGVPLRPFQHGMGGSHQPERSAPPCERFNHGGCTDPNCEKSHQPDEFSFQLQPGLPNACKAFMLYQKSCLRSDCPYSHLPRAVGMPTSSLARFRETLNELRKGDGPFVRPNLPKIAHLVNMKLRKPEGSACTAEEMFDILSHADHRAVVFYPLGPVICRNHLMEPHGCTRANCTYSHDLTRLRLTTRSYGNLMDFFVALNEYPDSIPTINRVLKTQTSSEVVHNIHGLNGAETRKYLKDLESRSLRLFDVSSRICKDHLLHPTGCQQQSHKVCGLSHDLQNAGLPLRNCKNLGHVIMEFVRREYGLGLLTDSQLNTLLSEPETDDTELDVSMSNGAEILLFLGINLKEEVRELEEAKRHEDKKQSSASGRTTIEYDGPNPPRQTYPPEVLATADALAKALPRQMFTGAELLKLIDKCELRVLKKFEEKHLKQETPAGTEFLRAKYAGLPSPGQARIPNLEKVASDADSSSSATPHHQISHEHHVVQAVTTAGALGGVIALNKLAGTPPARSPLRPHSPVEPVPDVIEAKKVGSIRNVETPQTPRPQPVQRSGRASALQFVDKKKEDSVLSAAMNAALASFVTSFSAQSSIKASPSSSKFEKKLEAVDEVTPTPSPLANKSSLSFNKSAATVHKAKIEGKENNPPPRKTTVKTRVNPQTGEIEEWRFNNGSWTWEKTNTLCRTCHVVFESSSALYEHLQESLAGPQPMHALQHPNSHLAQFITFQKMKTLKR